VLGTIAGVIVGLRDRALALARGVGITFISALFRFEDRAGCRLLNSLAGIGEEPKIGAIALGVVLLHPRFSSIAARCWPRNLIRMAQSLQCAFHAIVNQVIWPGAMPSILAGFRITASVALLLVVSAEMIGGPIRHRRLRAAGRQPDAKPIRYSPVS